LALGLSAIALLTFAGCSSSGPEDEQQPQIAPVSRQHKEITDLSEISTSGGVNMPALSSPSSNGAAGPNTAVQHNIEKYFVATAPDTAYTESAKPPSESELLNPKAKQFSEFSYDLLRKAIAAAQEIETDKLHQRKLPDDIGPTVLTAVMDNNGRLKELVIESRSGDQAVDGVVIDACKKGLWSRNPPAAAMDADGGYRFRVEGLIRNYTIDRNGAFHYSTRFGLGIL
jgi:hypothetical protein